MDETGSTPSGGWDIIMADSTEQDPTPLLPKRKVSRRSALIGLVGLAMVEAVAGGINWKVLSQVLSKFIHAFATPVPTFTPTPVPPGLTFLIYKLHTGAVYTLAWGIHIASGGQDDKVRVWDPTLPN